MINFLVRDLDGMVAQLRTAGADVDGEIETEEGAGRCARGDRSRRRLDPALGAAPQGIADDEHARTRVLDLDGCGSRAAADRVLADAWISSVPTLTSARRSRPRAAVNSREPVKATA
jgi:hypothetical protein